MNFVRSLDLSRRRSRFEIYVDVLRIIESGINKPTRIMFAANLSWRTLKEVLAELKKRGLIERRTVDKRNLFFITEEGRRILDTFETLATVFVNQDLTFNIYTPNKKSLKEKYS
ncbi:MAG: DUF4364 family protein [Candidatus Bathyarchaeia archaeon]